MDIRAVRWLAGASCLLASFAVGCSRTIVIAPMARFVVGTGGNFATIADALNAAPPGETIRVMAGTYGERVVISKPVTLAGERAILDGQRGGLDGRGIGIHVRAVNDVEIAGFVVQNFERGIVLENARKCRLRANEVHHNTNKSANTSPPNVPGVDPYEGIVLVDSQSNELVENFSHDNGHDGIMIRGSSTGNLVRANRFVNNGVQTTPGLFG